MEWETVKLGEVCDISIGRTPPRKEHEWFNQATPNYKWVSIKDMGDCGKFIYKTSETISKKGQIRYKIPIVAPNTILLSFKLTVGRIAITCDSPMLTNEAIAQLPINDETIVNKDYLFYYLKSFNYNSLGSTSSIANAVNSKMIRDIDIPLPPLEAQRRIAAILSSLDDKIENNNRINRNLEEQAQALFKSWFVDFEPWGGTMPEDWKEGTIADLVNLLNGFAFKSSDFVANGIFNLITIKGVQDGKMTTDGADHLDATPAKMPNWCLLRKGDILLSLTGNVGRCCLVDIENCLLNQRVAKLQPRAEYNRLFVYTLFRQEEMKSRMISISRGTAQMNLSPIETGKLSIIVPTDKVLENFGMRYNGILDIIINNVSENQRLAALRDSLLPKLMKGEIEL